MELRLCTAARPAFAVIAAAACQSAAAVRHDIASQYAPAVDYSQNLAIYWVPKCMLDLCLVLQVTSPLELTLLAEKDYFKLLVRA